MKGKVKWFDGKKGYGFITGEDGKEVFVHYSGIVKDGFKALNEKQEVEYELGEGSKGIQAINVKVVEGVSSAASDVYKRQIKIFCNFGREKNRFGTSEQS